MTADEFRKMALSLPEAIEAAHMNHPDFRAGGKIFATLGFPGDEWGMVKLTPEEQKAFIEAEPDTFSSAKGAWGRQGATMISLPAADKQTLRKALDCAWRNTAPTATSAKKKRRSK
jgi:hypothetical protein